MEKSGQGERKKVFYPGEEYWAVVDSQVHLVGSHCRKCGQNYFPPREICPKCFAEEEMDAIRLSNHGNLYSYTIVHVAPKMFMPPYSLGYVDFPEGVRVLGRLTTTDLSQLKLDMTVQSELGRIAVDEQGNDVISYQFRPV